MRYSVITVFVILAAGPARADSWTHDVSFAANGKTSLKVVGAKTLRVRIVVDGEAKEDSLPTVFPLPDDDAFIAVTVTAADGASWSDKIEIRHRQQTTLSASYSPEPAGAAPARSYAGNLYNFTSRCGKEWRGEVQFDAISKQSGKSAGSVAIKAEAGKQAELTAGHYDVRVSLRRTNATEFTYVSTHDLDVTSDDWLFAWGCRTADDRPTRLQKPPH